MCQFVDGLSEERECYPLIGTKRQPEFYDEEHESVVFGWDGIKWYENIFADVGNIVKALDELEANGIPYEFCRIGESWDDIEFTTSGENDELALHIEPSVVIDVF